MGAFDAALLAAIGLFFVEDATVRLGLYGLAAASLVLTPMVLRRAAEN
ncbi:hypothetical protein [Natronomonas pharaonis]|nr:hypothetical protein [Natronomonas pharaonis]